MDVSQLGELVQFYLQASLAPSTKRTYATGQRRYLNFCSVTRVSPLPVTEFVLCAFTASLAHNNLKHQSIKTYLSAVRNLQIITGQGDPFHQPLPLLEYVLRGIKSEQAKKSPSPSRTRLSITPEILLSIRSSWEKDAANVDHVMLWAACCTCFFGFLRSGEVTTPSAREYDPGAHLSYGDVTLDNTSNPSVVQVVIKASKADPFRKGVKVYLGRTDNKLCPVAAVAAYLEIRHKQGAGPSSNSNQA